MTKFAEKFAEFWNSCTPAAKAGLVVLGLLVVSSGGRPERTERVERAPITSPLEPLPGCREAVIHSDVVLYADPGCSVRLGRIVGGSSKDDLVRIDYEVDGKIVRETKTRSAVYRAYSSWGDKAIARAEWRRID